MKRVLITGANSYVGTNVEKWLMKEPDKYYVETLDMKDPNWRNFDFSKFDVVFHVAGIAHVSLKNKMKDLYLHINTNLAISAADKAKIEGVNHFIFMSSIIVYNKNETHITSETTPNPDNFYGLSKIKAEIGILKLKDDKFHVTIIRSPMIYGKYSKGNFMRLIDLSMKIRIFPNYINKRSMIYIENLNIIVKKIISNKIYGIIYPQNKQLMSTIEIVRYIANKNGNKIYFTKIFNPFISLMKYFNKTINSLFSDFYYDEELSFDFDDLSFKDNFESIDEIIDK